MRLKLDYVDVAVLLRVLTARNKSGAAFHVFGGPSVGIGVRAKATGQPSRANPTAGISART